MKKIILVLILTSSAFSIFGFNDQDDAIRIINEYTALSKSHREAYLLNDSEKLKILRMRLEDYYEIKLLPSLDNIEASFCRNGSVELVECYIEMLIASRGSAAEAPSWTFGKMFICRQNLVFKAVKECSDLELIKRNLSLGFESVLYEADTSGIDIKKLRFLIEEL